MLGRLGFRRRRRSAQRTAEPPRSRRAAWAWVRNVLRLGQPAPRPATSGVRLPDSAATASAADSQGSQLLRQRSELRERLLVHDPTTQIVRNLYKVHNALKNGWSGVEALPVKVVGRALIEAEILAVEEPSDLLASIVEGLKQAREAIERRGADEALASHRSSAPEPEVSHADFDEFELIERSWAGTLPGELQHLRQTV